MFQETSKQCGQVLLRAFTLRNAMRSIGVGHKLNLNIVFNEFIQQKLCILIMNIIIARTMDVKQFCLDVLGVCNG